MTDKMQSTMTNDQARTSDETNRTDRKYQLAGFAAGIILGLLIVVPLAFLIVG